MALVLNDETSGRSDFIDVARGIGILCVFCGHLFYILSPVCRLMFSFHLPLFFCLSGMVFRSAAIQSFSELRVRVLRRFILPYFYFIILSFIPYFFRGPCHIDFEFILRLVKSVFFNGYPMVNGALWFLTCLAMVQIVYWSLRKTLKLELLIACSFAVGIGMAILLQIYPRMISWMPLKLETVPLATVYFALGCLCKSMIERIRHGGLLVLLVGLGILLCLNSFSPFSSLQGVGIHSWMFFPMSFLGSCSVFLLSGLIVRSPNSMIAKGLIYIGRNSLCYFCLEFVTLPILMFLGRMCGFRCVFFPALVKHSISTSICLLACQIVIVSVLVSPVKKGFKVFEKTIMGKISGRFVCETGRI